MKLHQRSEYKNMTPRPSDDDYRSMKEDIKQHGQRLPIAVNKDGVILDGYTRLQICEELGLKVKHAIIPTKSPEIERDLILSMNLKRRHLNTIQKIRLAIPFYKAEQKQAEKRMKKGTVAEISARGRSAKKAAKMIGVSESTFERGMYVIEKASKDVQKKLDTNSMAINTAYGLLTRETRNLPKTPPPKGEFDVFLCDVPIAYDDKGGRGAAENHYSTMTAEELSDMHLHSAKDAIMFFWIPSSIQYSEVGKVDGWSTDNSPVYKFILDAWGFGVVGEFVWNKGRIGRGNYNRNQHENLLIAVKGTMPKPAKLYPSIIDAPRGKHSEKPEIVYEMIEKMYPKRKYVELFARKKRKGWTSHGNQLKAPEKIWICKACGDNKEIPKEQWGNHISRNHGKRTGDIKRYFIQIKK